MTPRLEPAKGRQPAGAMAHDEPHHEPVRAASRNSTNLKRVSFGSLKGSMVETLVYQDQGPAHELAPLLNGGCLEEEDAWRVRVTVYDAQRPHLVSSPESPSLDLMSVPVAMATPPPHDGYLRQQSDSGLDNPFRPDGELSKEADTIVSLIKEGKPITPVKGEADGFLGDQGDGSRANGGGDTKVAPSRAPGPLGAERRQDTNGSTPASLKKGLVEVQHGIVVPPSDPSTVEQVMIKKKPKCKCCVIQ
ncbi:uncharacterized protein ISCGN_023523 [Ixodes scapularis]